MTTIPKKPSLKVSSAWVFTGSLTYGFCQFDLTKSIVIPIFSLLNLHLRAVQATDAKVDFTFADYFGLRLLTTCTALMLIMAIVLGGWQPEMIWVILAVGVMKAAEALNDLTYGCLQQHEYMRWISVSMISRGFFWLFGAAGVIALGGTLWQAVLLIAVGNLLLFFGHDLRRVLQLLLAKAGGSWRDILPSFHWQTLSKLFILSSPLALIYMMAILTDCIPHYFLAWKHGDVILGVFALLLTLTLPLDLALIAVGQSASPRLAKYYAFGNLKSLRKLTFKLSGFGLILGLAFAGGAYFLNKPIVTLFFGDKLASYEHYLFYIALALLPGSISDGLAYAMTATRLWRKMLAGYIVIVALFLVTCYLLIPTYGLMGAIWAFAIRGCFTTVVIFVMLWHAFKVAAKKEKAE